MPLRRPACFVAMIALVLAASTVAGARADSGLIIPQPGFQTPHRPVWQQVFALVPSTLRPRNGVVVREVSDAQMEEQIKINFDEPARQDPDSVIDGIFVQTSDGTATITLRRSLHGSDAALVFAHEFGHFVWDTHLTASQRRAYCTAYKKARAQKQLVTEYAGDSVEEGFGEAFSYFLLRRDTLAKKDPLALALFQTWTANPTTSLASARPAR